MIKLLAIQPSQLPYYLIPLEPKYLPHHPILEHHISHPYTTTGIYFNLCVFEYAFYSMFTYIIGAKGYCVFANFSGGYEALPRPISGYLIGLIATLW
jgi:hypothetical protein